MTAFTYQSAARTETPPCQRFFGLLDPAAACDELHGFEITMDSRIVAPELHLSNDGEGLNNLLGTHLALAR